MHHAHIALKFSARHADEGSGRHIAQSDRALRSGISNPAVNACRPGEGRPGIHTLGVGPFFGCARIPAAQKAMPAAMWPATGHPPSTLPLARTSVDG